MAPRPDRPLTEGEWAALTPGLARALRGAGAAPLLRDRNHPGAAIAALWRGGQAPVLTRHDVIWWSRAADDLSRPGQEQGMSVLQHELQHVLDYRIGWLTLVRYVLRPANWSYDWAITPGRPWDDYGAEQRASIAEQIWLADNGLAPQNSVEALRRLVPWA